MGEEVERGGGGGLFCNCKISIVQVMGEEVERGVGVGGGGLFCNCKISIVQVNGKAPSRLCAVAAVDRHTDPHT